MFFLVVAHAHAVDSLILVPIELCPGTLPDRGVFRHRRQAVSVILFIVGLGIRSGVVSIELLSLHDPRHREVLIKLLALINRDITLAFLGLIVMMLLGHLFIIGQSLPSVLHGLARFLLGLLLLLLFFEVFFSLGRSVLS